MTSHLERLAAEIQEQEKLRPGEEKTYRLYEDLSSPYSAKVRAYLHYKKIPYRRLRATFSAYMQRIPELVGFPILPVLLAPDGTVLQDSTPILEHLEATFVEPGAIPEDPRVALVMWLVEDFADEYVPRFSMHYRWGNEISRETLSHRIARRFTYGDPHNHPRDLAPSVLVRQSGFDGPLGLDETTRPDVDAQLLEILAALEARFREHAFLFGDRPSLADFALYGQLWAHLFNDPFSMHILETKAPFTCHWMEGITELGDTRGAVGRSSFGSFLGWPEAIEGLGALLGIVAPTYVPIGMATLRATAAKEKRIELPIRGIQTSMAAPQYRAWAFEQLQRRFDGLSAAHRSDVGAELSRHGDYAPLLAGERIHNPLFDGLTPPVVVGGIADNRVKHKKMSGR